MQSWIVSGEEAGARLDKFLAAAGRLGSRGRAASALERGKVLVNDADAGPFRYLRLREPPYTDDDLATFTATVRDPAYVYVRHEDEPTAPETVRRLRKLLG